jgi:hypothetical protein
MGASANSKSATHSPLTPPPKIDLTSKTILVKTVKCLGNKCWLCHSNDTSLHQPTPDSLRAKIYSEVGVWVEAPSVICRSHIVREGIRHKDLQLLKPVLTTVSQSVVRDLIKNISVKKSIIDFDDFSLTELDYKRLTGISKSNFDDLLENLRLKDRGGPSSPRNSLGMFMMKLRTGASHSELSTMFRVHMKTIYRKVRAVRQAFFVRGGFVQLNLGANALTREQLITDHTSMIAKTLFGPNRLILIEDATYLYIQKSFNFFHARHTFCVHKKRHLVKPMVCCTTTGRFIDIFGPYYSNSKNSDACIFSHQMKDQMKQEAAQLRKLMKGDDLWVVDRGFQGAAGSEADVQMPAFKQKASTQLDTSAANHSRKITKVRWVVEAANGRLKQFKFLARVISNNQLPMLGDYCRIVAALCNKYRPPLTKDRPHHHQMAKKMLAREKLNNDLKSKCIGGGVHHKKDKNSWERVSRINNFPILTKTELEHHVTFGCYQIEQADNYLHEHLCNNDEFTVFRSRSDPNVIRSRLQSRHKNRKQYDVYIELDPSKLAAWEKLKGWYCGCTSGARTIGCCSHVTAVIWWLGLGRLQGKRERKHLWLNIINAGDCQEEIDIFDEDPWSDISDQDDNESLGSEMPGDYDGDDNDNIDEQEVEATTNSQTQSLHPFSLSTVVVEVEPPTRDQIAAAIDVMDIDNSATQVIVEINDEDDDDAQHISCQLTQEVRVAKATFLNIGKEIQITTPLSDLVARGTLSTKERAHVHAIHQVLKESIDKAERVKFVIDGIDASFETLKPFLESSSGTEQWLNGDLINLYVMMLNNEFPQAVYGLSTFFSPALATAETNARMMWARCEAVLLD